MINRAALNNTHICWILDLVLGSLLEKCAKTKGRATQVRCQATFDSGWLGTVACGRCRFCGSFSFSLISVMSDHKMLLADVQTLNTRLGPRWGRALRTDGRTVERRHGVSSGEVEPVQESSHLFGVSTTSSVFIDFFKTPKLEQRVIDTLVLGRIKYPAAAACPSVCPLRCRRLAPVAHRPLCPPLYAHSCALTTTLISP